MARAGIQKQKVEPLPIFQKITTNKQAAATTCADRYGNLIWAMARNLTDSPADAEQAVREIFLEIWRSARRSDSTDFDELIFITIAARRHFIERSKNITEPI